MEREAIEQIPPQRLIKPQRLTSEECARLSELNSNLVDQLALWANKQLTCSHCKRCTLRCEVLNDPNLDIGQVEEAFTQIMSYPEDERVDVTIHVVQENPALYHALRRCCFCGYCTSTCRTHMLGADRMRDWRRLFAQAGIMPVDDTRLTLVDNEWHIFSAFRAIYGVEYPDYLTLAHAAEQGPGTVDTLFFPGCTLVSYAPELMKTVGDFLTNAGMKWAITDDCCGSPLESAGLPDRAAALREKIREQALAAGITRVITVCPGCGEEMAETFGEDIDIVPLPEVLQIIGESRLEARISTGFVPLANVPSVTFFDSCHDRYDGRHGVAIRKLLAAHAPQIEQREMDHNRKAALCCGAGGAVAAYDSDISSRRPWRVIDEARRTGADTMVTMCPTCTYTFAQMRLEADYSRASINTLHYLEILFGQEINWAQIFEQLGSMWSGEYGPWLNETFFS